MKRVAVIGGGPSGLATAKALLDVGLSPVIFEAASSVGGLWNRSGSSRRVWDRLRTNLSKYTCCFADMPWSIDAPLHPTNQQVEEYLQQYCTQFLSNRIPSSIVSSSTTNELLMPTFHFNTRITNLSRNSESGKYCLQFETAGGSTDAINKGREEFDKVVIASGFFNTTQSHYFHDRNNVLFDNVICSDEYRNPESFKGKTVMIVGASFSGCEIAAEIASVAKKVYHIVPRYSFVVPRMLPLSPNNPATAFLPMDLVFYTLNEERQHLLQRYFPHQSKNITVSEEYSEDRSQFEVLFKDAKETQKTVSFLSKIVGTGNPHVDPLGKLASSFINKSKEGTEKPMVSISDEYKSMVCAGKIVVIPGRYINHSTIQSSSGTRINLKNGCDNNDYSSDIDDVIDQTIFCTGYSPDVSFFDSSILSTLQYSSEDNLLPMILYKEQFHPSLPGLHFVGMYKGPYFGVIELQARLAAQYLAGLKPLPSPEIIAKGLGDSQTIRNQIPKPQFPHSDYEGMMLDLAMDLGLSIGQVTNANGQQVLVPSLFVNSNCESNGESVLCAMHQEIEDRKRGKGLGHSIIYALEGGTWTLQRELFDKDNGTTSTVEGKVKFSLITEPDYSDKHLWYHEEGTFTTARGAKFDVSQSYIYSYNRDLDRLDIYFSTVGNPTVIDRPFISLQFQPSERGWIAKADHLCGEDNYYADFEISFKGLNIDKMKIIFDVLGPAKNYRSTTVFQLLK